MKRKLLVIDTETGGLDPATDAIMSIGLVVYHDGHIDDTLYMEIEDHTGRKDPLAMTINGLEGTGFEPWRAVATIKQMLLRNNMFGKVTLAGHNLPFDVGFLQRLYRLANEDYNEQFNYGGLCTKTAALLLEQFGRLSIASSHLTDVAAALGVPVWVEHSALNDALATAEVLGKMSKRFA